MALSVATAIAIQEVVSMQYPPGKGFVFEQILADIVFHDLSNCSDVICQ